MSSLPTLPANVITLRVGIALHYIPHQFEKNQDHDQPFLAHVVHINPNGTVNIVLHNEIGIAVRRINIFVAHIDKATPGQCEFPRA